MNYFGHAALSVWRAKARHQSNPERFILGSMLPDLLPMARCFGTVPFVDPEIEAGMAFHLEVDAHFHVATQFINWNRRVLAELRQAGVARGPARASAHMGVEMLIDAELAKNPELYDGYLAALSLGSGSPHLFSPRPSEETQRIQSLCAHLVDRGAAVHQATEDRFHTRLLGTLGHRPRLAPTSDELTIIAKHLCSFEVVRQEYDQLLNQLQSTLGLVAPPPLEAPIS